MEADKRVYDANAALTELRTARDTLAAALANAIVRLRRLVLALYLSPNMVGLSLQSPQQYVADPLIRQVEMIDERFRRDDLANLLGPLVDGADPVDVGKSVTIAVETADKLRTALHQIDEAQRDLDEAIVEKDRLKEEHQEVFVYTARTFEAHCRLAGERKLAAKVRPSERRLGRRAEEEEDSPPPGPEPEPAGAEADSQEEATA